MKIVEITPLSNGAHRNQTVDKLSTLPDNWAVIPDGLETPNFPFGELTAEKIGGVMTVTRWTAGAIPEPEPETKSEPTTEELLNIILGVSE